MKAWSRFIVPTLLACLAVLTIALSVLQFNWIKQAADTETLAIRRQMALSAAEGIQEIRKQLTAYSDLIADLPLDENIDEVTVQYSESIGVPDLITNVFVVYPNNGGTIVSRFGSGSPEQVLGSDFLEAFAEAESNRFRVIGLAGHALSKGIFINFPQEERRRTEEERQEIPVQPFFILAMNTGLLTNDLIIPAMSEALGEYDIRLSNKGEAFFTTGNISTGRQAEIAFPLDYLLGAGASFARLQEGLSGGPSPLSITEGGLLMYYRFILDSNSATAERVADDPRPQPDYFIEVFYPDSSLAKVIRFRTVVNTAISFTVLFLLFMTALVLYRFSRRLSFQRSREQEFVASISHELRTPITVIKAAAGNLSDGMVTGADRVRQYGREISDQSQRLERMVEGILLYSGISSNRKLDGTIVDLERVIGDLESSFLSVSERVGMTFSSHFEGVPRIRTDMTALNLILENLVMNAFIHGESEGGEVSLIVRSGPFNKLSIVVEDAGPGIPKHEQRRIFDPFVRGERSVSDQHPGSGLGLHLIQRVVTGMEGTITVESPYMGRNGEQISGCRFCVEISTEHTSER